MRWLVPAAAPMSRNDRPPIPPLPKASISASSSSLRRASSATRGTVPQLLAVPLETCRLEGEVALREPEHQQADDDPDRPTLFDALTYLRAIVVGGEHLVAPECRTTR